MKMMQRKNVKKIVHLERNLHMTVEKKKGRLYKYSTLFLFIVFILYIYNIHTAMRMASEKTVHRTPYFKNINDKLPKARDVSSSYTVDSAACRIPALDPWDIMIRPYMRKMKTIQCSSGIPLIASNDSFIYVVQRALQYYSVRDPEDLRCCYRPFYRIIVEDSPSDDDIRYEKECTFFKDEVLIRNTEFVHIKCYNDEQLIYEDYHAFVPKKLKVEKRCRKTEKHADGGAVSVLVIGTDSLSRMNMYRQMPLTVARLRALDAIEMLGYNKVGTSTFPNLVAMLTGFSEYELGMDCLNSRQNFADDCRYVWNEFHDVGFRTAFGEDATWLGIFNYQRPGFAKQPTDYYLRPFLSNVEDNIGHNQPINVKFCAGARSVAKVLFDYIVKFSLQFKNKLSFAIFWESTLAHDFLNTPRIGDKLYLSFLNILKQNGALDRLALLFVSDHGMRSGGIQKTYQGRLEDRQPHFFLILPPRFRQRYATAVANMKNNAHRLTTHYDLHETLKDLARPTERLSEEALLIRTSALLETRLKGPPRGISLFLQIPPNRSCMQAGIPSASCICQVNVTIDMGMRYLKKVANTVVKYINNILKPFHQCSYLFLTSVRSIQLQIPRFHLREKTIDKGVFDIVVVLRTKPGEAEFESTVREKPTTRELMVVGGVNRLNMDEARSTCANNTRIKQFCLCKS